MISLWLKVSLLVLLFISGCAKKEVVLVKPLYDNQSDNKSQYIERLKELVKQVNGSTKTICSYKSSVIFDYQDEKIKIKMKGLVEKDCENNGELVILGPFGMVLYNAKYNNGVLDIKKDNDSVALNSNQTKKLEEMLRYIHLLNYPGIRPDESYLFYEDGRRIIFQKDDIAIFAEDYKITKIVKDDLEATYTVVDGSIKEIQLHQESKKRFLKIIFN
ncbi:MAG: hypothetical protein N3C60_03090 [Calditerrivibrio sp.]|nr:hypothetical protein [Calditerrivibrio sp.]